MRQLLSLLRADVYKRQMLGRAKSVKVQKENTVIVNGFGEKADIQSRIGQIKAQIGETTSDSVSYTHLDVYKRQIYRRAGIELPDRFPVVKVEND